MIMARLLLAIGREELVAAGTHETTPGGRACRFVWAGILLCFGDVVSPEI
jgi:hypothetical protein